MNRFAYGETEHIDVDLLSDRGLRKLTEEISVFAEKNDEEAGFPFEAIQRAWELGVYEHVYASSSENSTTDDLRLIQALGKADPSVALIIANTLTSARAEEHVHQWPVYLWERVKEEAKARPVNINAARAEPELGAPARGGLPQTLIRKVGDSWEVSGRKAYVTASTALDYHVVWVRTDEENPKVGHVIVPRYGEDGREDQGVEIIPTWDHLGLRASSTHDVVYRSVKVPLENFTEIPRIGGKYIDPASRGASFHHTAIYIGVARAAQDFFHEFSYQRIPAALGKPIAETERIQSVAGELEGLLVQAEELLFGLQARIDAGDEAAVAKTVIAKPFIVRSIVTAVEKAVASLGNPALSRHHPLERHLRNVLCARVHPPQEDTALIAAGRAALERYKAKRD